MLPNLLPLIHNSKYSKTTLLLIEGLLSAHTEPASWKSQLLLHLDQ